MNKVGRPTKDVNLEELLTLVIIFKASTRELEQFFNCSRDTIQRVWKKNGGDFPLALARKLPRNYEVLRGMLDSHTLTRTLAVKA